MRRFDFVTLKLFISVADEGRLTAAAEREHLALAAVSKRISDLEALVGTTLLYRRPRGVELTPAGQAFLHHARRILDNIERLHAELSEYGEGVRSCAYSFQYLGNHRLSPPGSQRLFPPLP